MKKNDLIIINPASNNGKAHKNFRKQLKKSPDNIQQVINNADMIVLDPDQHISGIKNLGNYRRIFICGGDGTINSLIRTCLKKKLTAKNETSI